ncbi:hypothetical protein AAMO2058_000975100 [Amorphochlora amoebiformis]
MGKGRKKAWKAISHETVKTKSAIELVDNEKLFFVDREGEQSRREAEIQRLKRASQRAKKPSTVAKPTQKKTIQSRPRTQNRKRSANRKPKVIVGDDEELKNLQESLKPQKIKLKVLENEGKLRDLWGVPSGTKAQGPKKRRKMLPRVPQSEASIAKSKFSRPMAAQSYNPDKKSQSELITRSAEIYQKELDEKEELEKKFAHDPNFPYVDPDSFEPDEEPAPEPGGNPVVRAEDRLTKKQKRKKEARKAEERLRQAKRMIKKTKEDFNRIKGIVKQIRKSGRILELKKQKKIQNQLANSTDPTKCKLGKKRFQPMFPEVLLSDEITGHLRDTVVSDNVVKAQFTRLQERKMIEPRDKMKKLKLRYLY